ncbi:carotenoid oxygenase family protein [soil metagenome]
MSKPFPSDEPFLRGAYEPLHMECDAHDLPITGEVPRALNGTLYRNGPNPQFAPRGPYHWFAGDGMLHAFQVQDGRVSYRNRWVRTPKWELEHAEGEGLSGAFGNPRFSDPRIVAMNSTVANTNIVWHAGRLLALEEAHAPFEVDAETLAPKGYHHFGGKLQGPMTAHPKLDPVTGEMVFFGYATRGRFGKEMAVHTADASGALVKSETFEAPFSSMAHDFVVSRRWIVLPIFPLTGSMDRAMKGAPPYAWEPGKGTHIALIPRGGSVADARWFVGEPCYVFHPMNAFDTEDGKVVCDMMKYPVAPLFPLPDGSPNSATSPVAKLVRWTFDPNGNTESFTEQPLDDHAAEFPRLDERRTGLPYRHGWFQAGTPTDASSAVRGREARNGVAHIDLASGAVSVWRPGVADQCGEPIFVPRRPGSEEGDGFVLSTIFRGAENRSDLAVFEARSIADGPIALVHLSHRVPAGFHGNWRDAPPGADAGD